MTVELPQGEVSCRRHVSAGILLGRAQVEQRDLAQPVVQLGGGEGALPQIGAEMTCHQRPRFGGGVLCQEANWP